MATAITHKLGYMISSFHENIFSYRASALFIGVYEPAKKKLLKMFPEDLSALAHLVCVFYLHFQVRLCINFVKTCMRILVGFLTTQLVNNFAPF